MEKRSSTFLILTFSVDNKINVLHVGWAVFFAHHHPSIKINGGQNAPPTIDLLSTENGRISNI